jgi:hypothetical protein
MAAALKTRETSEMVSELLHFFDFFVKSKIINNMLIKKCSLDPSSIAFFGICDEIGGLTGNDWVPAMCWYAGSASTG